MVEGPSMVLAGDRHLLLYSGGNWNSAGYAVGYAVCDGPAGPVLQAERPAALRRAATGSRAPVARSRSGTSKAGCG